MNRERSVCIGSGQLAWASGRRAPCPACGRSVPTVSAGNTSVGMSVLVTHYEPAPAGSGQRSTDAPTLGLGL